MGVAEQIYWKTTEVAMLREIYPVGGTRAVHQHVPHHTRQAIRNMAARVGVQTFRRFTPEEDAILRAHYPAGGTQACIPLLEGRDERSLVTRAKRLGLRRIKGWDPQDDHYIHRFYLSHGVEHIMQLLPGRAGGTIRRRASELGIRRPSGNGGCPRWTAHEDGIMRVHYPTGGVAACAPLLPQRTRAAVERRRQLRLAHDAAAALTSIAWLTPALPYFPKRTTRRHRA